MLQQIFQSDYFQDVVLPSKALPQELLCNSNIGLEVRVPSNCARVLAKGKEGFADSDLYEQRPGILVGFKLEMLP